MAEKLEMISSNLIDENIEYISKKFPGALKEVIENGKTVKKIDFDILKQELSTVIVDDNQERYQMTWPDKKKSIHLANTRTTSTLRPNKEKSVNFENTENLYIEGDNLEALKLLRETYLKKIKMIYIDPPYNTGNDFVYEDDFSQSTDEYKTSSGEYDSEGNRLVQNIESNGRFHTDWLNMMYPRLKLAKDLLSEDGLIFISIGDTEYANLRKICDDIFFPRNFVATFVWEKTQHFGRQTRNFYSNVDYVLCYANNLIKEKISELLVESINTELLDAPLFNASNNEKTLTFPANTVKFNMKDGVYSKTTSPEYELINSVTVKNGKNSNEFKLKFRSRWADDTVQLEISKGTTFWVKTKNFAIRAIYGDGKQTNVSPRQIIFTNSSNKMHTKSRLNQKVGTNENATADLIKLMGKQVFSYPKPVSLIKYLLTLIYDENKGDFLNNFIVMDFFSGSGTTAQAIMELNEETNSKIKFILVQLPEDLEENLKYANNPSSREIIMNAISLCDEIKQERVLTSVGQERLRRAGKEITKRTESKSLDVGFRVLEVASSNMNDVYYNPTEMSQSLLDQSVDNIRKDRTHLDLLFQVMLQLGINLSAKIEEKESHGKRYFVVDNNNLIACFDDGISDIVISELANAKPSRVVFRDLSFESDSASINSEQIFKTISPSTKLWVI